MENKHRFYRREWVHKLTVCGGRLPSREKIYRAWQASIFQIINLRIWKSCIVLHTDILLPYSLRKWKYGDGKKKSCSRLLQILIVLHSKHEKISVRRTIHDFHVLRFIFKIIFEMKYFHRNYFFLLIGSALTTVLWSLTYTTTRHRTRFSLWWQSTALPKRLVLQKTLDYGQTAREVILTTHYYFVAET